MRFHSIDRIRFQVHLMAFLCRDEDGVFEVFTIDPEPFVLMRAEIPLPT